MLAINLSAPRGVRLPVSSFTSIASMLAPTVGEFVLAVVDVTMQPTIVQLLEYRTSSVFLKTAFGMEVEQFVVEDFQSEASRRRWVHGQARLAVRLLFL
jgi:hypothetical protein